MRKLWLSVMLFGMTLAFAQPAHALRPSGWVYHNHPWAYDNGSGDWHWFNPANTQWIAHMGNSEWAVLPESAMASGWVYYQWPFAYAQGNNAWHWINEPDTQWVVNMRTGAWSRLGEAVSPSLAGLAGTWTGTNSFGENIRAILAPDGSFSFTVPNGTSTGTLSLSGSHLSGTYGAGFGTFSGNVSGNTMIGQFSELDGDHATFTMVRQPT